MTRALVALRGMLIALAAGLAVVILGALAVVLSPLVALAWLLTPAKEAKALSSLFAQVAQARAERPQA